MPCIVSRSLRDYRKAEQSGTNKELLLEMASVVKESGAILAFDGMTVKDGIFYPLLHPAGRVVARSAGHSLPVGARVDALRRADRLFL